MSKSRKDSRPGASKGGKNGKPTQEMNRDLRNALEAIRKLLGASDAQEADAKYKVGRQVQEIQADPDKYGKAAVKLLAQELRCGKDVLYNCARVVKTWTLPAFAELLQRKGANGLPLSFSHYVKLSLEERADVREALVHQVLEKGLSVEETADLVKSQRVSGGMKSGRRRKQPLHRELRQLEMRSQKLVERTGKVLTELKKEETVASEVVSSLRNMAKLFGEAGAQCASVADQHGATSKPALEQADAMAQLSEPQQKQTQPSEPQQEHPQSEAQVSSSPEPTADFLHVQKIDDPADPQNETPPRSSRGPDRS